MLKQNDEAKTLLKFTTTSIQDLTRRHLQKMFCQKEWLLKQENTCFNTSHIHPHIIFIYYFPQCPLAWKNLVKEDGKGAASIFVVKCHFCGYLNTASTSMQHRTGKRGPMARCKYKASSWSSKCWDRPHTCKFTFVMSRHPHCKPCNI